MTKKKNREQTKLRIIQLFLVFIIVILPVRSCLKQKNDYRLIKKDYKIVLGRIIDYRSSVIAGKALEYSYFVDSVNM